jgi:peptidoglycan biosynthesis protein MviN/MurJ (putative lipid II flippase)
MSMGRRIDAIPLWLRRTGVEVLGWTLILIGVAMLVLPGPGLLVIAGGLVVLSVHNEWAKHLLGRVKIRALRLAIKEVQTWPRIVAGAMAGFVAVAAGIAWAAQPPMPEWWTFGEQWWLPGGWAVGLVMIASGLLALLLLHYCFRRFHRPRSSPRRRNSRRKNPGR